MVTRLWMFAFIDTDKDESEFPYPRQLYAVKDIAEDVLRAEAAQQYGIVVHRLNWFDVHDEEGRVWAAELSDKITVVLYEVKFKT